MAKVEQSNAKFDDDEIDLGALALRLWAGKVLIGVCTVIAGIIGLIVALGTPPTYNAIALLQLEEKSGQLALPESLTGLAANDPRSVTEIEIITSRMVLGQAAADAQVDWRASPRTLPLPLNALANIGIPVPEVLGLDAFARPEDRLRLDLLEVPQDWLGETIVLTVEEGNSFRLTLPDDSELSGIADTTVMAPERGFALRVGDLAAAPGREFEITHLSENAVIRDLRARLSVAERGRQSGILELRLTGRDLESTERVLDAITQAYLNQNVSRSAAEAESSLVFVESQIPAAETKIRDAERSLNDYRQQQQAIDLGFEGQSLLTQISSLEDQLQQLNNEEATLANRYTPNHPEYQQLINSRQRLEDRLERLRDEVANLPTTQREVLNLTRDFELAQSVYVELLNRAQELRVLRASTIGNVRIVDSANADDRPIAPRRSLILALSLVLGFFGGVGVVLVQNFLRRGIQSAEEITSLGIPVFATVNLNLKTQKQNKRKTNLPILALTDPTDLTIEGFRSLRTSLHFAMLDADKKVVTLTSASPDSGKSFTSINLGVVAAQAGQSVCVVDADMRRGHLRRYFDLPKSHPGLADYLSGQANLDDIIVKSSTSGLSFISTGKYPPNPSELLMRPKFEDLITELDKRFDLSIIDTPPVLAVTDPLIVGKATGATIAIVRFDFTTAHQIEVMQSQLLQAGGRLSGAILNGFDPRRVKAGSAYGYSYRYDYRQDETEA